MRKLFLLLFIFTILDASRKEKFVKIELEDLEKSKGDGCVFDDADCAMISSEVSNEMLFMALNDPLSEEVEDEWRGRLRKEERRRVSRSTLAIIREAARIFPEALAALDNVKL